MRVLLKVGHTDLLLPDDKGIATIMKALSQAIEVDDYLYKSEPEVLFRGELRLEMKLVPRTAKVRGLPAPERSRRAKPLALPEPNSILL